ncbi:MAG TPA: hypothetical protein VLG12_03655 [Candidatus Saccharimonadales bacterium]|nr:hypothetical protein [Candidatus Saccharimonadales bacterium]
MLQTLGIIAGILTIIGALPYIRDILFNKTKPERATWFIWIVLASIAFSSQFAKGASNSLWLTGLESIAVFVIFILSIQRGVGGLNKRDIVILLVAMLGLILWYFTKEASFALYIIIGVDLTGTIPTVIKAYEDPESETFITWLLSSIAGVLTMISVGKLNLILLSYPFYIFVANGAVVVAMVFGKKRMTKTTKLHN